MIRFVSRMARPASRVLAPIACAWVLASPARGGEASLEEKLLDNKYRRGDYAVYFAWHDPEDWQFDEHGSHASPFGLKVRFRWLVWLRLEGDVAYYQSGNELPIPISIFQPPQFDGLLVGGLVQARVRSRGLLRPFVGAGPLFVSLGNDFLVFRPDVRDAAPSNPDQFALASWSRFDLGWMAAAGLDIDLGRRWSPFVEARHLFGSLTLDDDDVRIGSLPLPPEDLHTVPVNGVGDGFPHSRHYDWSGPFISLGLRIRF
jgi:hypothetical protein